MCEPASHPTRSTPSLSQSIEQELAPTTTKGTRRTPCLWGLAVALLGMPMLGAATTTKLDSGLRTGKTTGAVSPATLDYRQVGACAGGGGGTKEASRVGRRIGKGSKQGGEEDRTV